MATQSVLEQQQEKRLVRPPPDQTLKCPRCDSTNTKFCYYNNYSLSQPRYFCKACRRYWTKGGSLRNVPVGGGCRKNKRTSSSSSSSKKNVAQLGRVMGGCTSSSNNNPVVNPSFFPSLLTYDSSDLTLAFDEHGAHNQYDFLGNYPCSTGFRSSFVDVIPSNLHCFYKVENGGDNCDEDNMVLSSAAAAEASTVTTGKQDQFYNNDDVREIGENSSKMYWNFPWQLGGEANIGSTSSTVIDSTGRECWINNGSSSSWPGLVNSSLM